MEEVIAAPLYIDLGSTPSYAHRRVGWFAGKGARADGRLGTVRIVIGAAKRSRDKDEVDEYGLQEETDRPPVYPGARTFLLENDDDPDLYGPFGVTVGTVECCGCEQGLRDAKRFRQVGCKHRAALAALVGEGVI